MCTCLKGGGDLDRELLGVVVRAGLGVRLLKSEDLPRVEAIEVGVTRCTDGLEVDLELGPPWEVTGLFSRARSLNS